MADLEPLAQQVQALLFAEGGALSITSLAKTLSCATADIQIALDSLAARLEGSGLSVVRSDTEATLAVSSVAKDVIVKKATEEFERDIGEAALEVVAILLYEGPSSRATIDYIRGVNSSSSIRTLLTRGLIERSGNPEDGREFIYRATTDLLAHMGTTNRESLPEYATISRELQAFKAQADHGTTNTE